MNLASFIERHAFMRCGIKCGQQFICIANCLQPVANLIIRLYVARIFWISGKLKLSNWDTTVYLFEFEHPVPFVPANIAAFFGTGAELLFPIMLFFGFGARVAALGLIVMTAVMELTYQHQEAHYFWMFMMMIVFCYGPGKIAFDHIIAQKFAAACNAMKPAKKKA